MTTPPITITANEVADEFRRRFPLEYELVVASLTVRKLQHELEHAHTATVDWRARAERAEEAAHLAEDRLQRYEQELPVDAEALRAENARLTQVCADYGAAVNDLRNQLTQARRRSGVTGPTDEEKVIIA